MPSEQGRRLLGGRYELGELIGRGGMGEVYAARDRRLDRDVAVKRLRTDLADQPRMRERVEAEARAAARLAHPNVVAVYDAGVDDGHPFIVMERLTGRTLADEIAAGPLDAALVRDVALQVLAALGAAHAMGLVHRDVKPGNVLAAPGDTWKVADFGIAKLADSDATSTRTGELLGSPSYAAPERLAGNEASAQSDLYSLGVVMYEALAGRRPFHGDDPIAVAVQIRESDLAPLHDAHPGAAPALADAVDRAMSVDPSRRFTSAADMATAIRGDVTTLAHRAASQGRRAHRCRVAPDSDTSHARIRWVARRSRTWPVAGAGSAAGDRARCRAAGRGAGVRARERRVGFPRRPEPFARTGHHEPGTHRLGRARTTAAGAEPPRGAPSASSPGRSRTSSGAGS